MRKEEALQRITVDPNVFGGKPVIKGTRVPVSVVLASLAEGLSPEQVNDHFPNVKPDDVIAALVYAAWLADENIWKLAV